MNKLQTITDFTVWLLFVISILATVILIVAGTYELVTHTTWGATRLLFASIITLGIHYAVRMFPQGGR